MFANDICLETGFFFFPWQIYRCVTKTFQRSNPRVDSTQAISPRGALEERSTATAPFIKIVLTVLANRLFCNWLGFSRAQFCKRSATIPRYVANKCHERNAIFGTVFLRIFFTAISGRWQLFYFLFVCLFL